MIRRLLITVFFCLTLFTVQGQNISNFLYYAGARQLATLAHPTNTFRSFEQAPYNGGTLVRITYDECATLLFLQHLGRVVYSIEVVQDNDFPGPFVATSFFKNLTIDTLKNMSEDMKTTLENRIGSSLREMDGKQLACFLLSANWMRRGD